MGLDAMLAALGPASAERLVTAFRQFESVRRSVVPVDHWYLQYIAVDPMAQGQGLGGRLLQPGLDRADASALPCYLETLERRNLGFYARHGFTVVAEGRLPGNGPPYWGLARPPRAPG